MSTPEQPQPPQLTRRQLRELRNTAATPIITPEDAAAALAAQAEAAHAAEPVDETADEPAADAPAEHVADDAANEAAVAPEPAPVAPLARAAEQTKLPEAPIADSEVDLDAPALTRRGKRQQERLRTASVPVVGGPVGEDAADAAPSTDDDTAVAEEATVEVEPVIEDVVVEEEPADQVEDAIVEDEHVDDEHVAAESVVEAEPVVDHAPVDADVAVDEAPVVEDAAVVEDEHVDDESVEAEPAAEDEELGTPALTFPPPAAVDLQPTFDREFERSAGSTGTLSVPNALILSQTPETGSLVSPVTSTGEILVTGTYMLPDRYGSTGTMPGAADGKDLDSALVDGELPAASSPLPIAASSAISTIKSADEVIKPPVPEKGGRLMMLLAITAGVLAVALAGVLILAFTTGVLQ